jgi:hypothetical protein
MKKGPFILVIVSILIVSIYINYNIKTSNNLSEEECYPFCEANLIENSSLVMLSLFSEEREVFYEKPVDLIISGFGGTLKILENSKINSIAVRGKSMKIFISKDLQPNIINLGTQFDLIYFD